MEATPCSRMISAGTTLIDCGVFRIFSGSASRLERRELTTTVSRLATSLVPHGRVASCANAAPMAAAEETPTPVKPNAARATLETPDSIRNIPSQALIDNHSQ